MKVENGKEGEASRKDLTLVFGIAPILNPRLDRVFALNGNQP